MNLFSIIDFGELQKEYNIKEMRLIDYSTGFDGNIYLMLSGILPKDTLKTQPVTAFSTTDPYCMVIVLYMCWEDQTVVQKELYDFGGTMCEYDFIRAYKDETFLMADSRCMYRPEKDLRHNVVVMDRQGNTKHSFCAGDGIQDILATPDGKIITSYFDEGIFGNFGWDNPIGEPGLILWDENGQAIWKNTNHDICDCYAMNMDASDRLWFYFYKKFDLVCTDFKKDLVYQPNVKGCTSFAISQHSQKLLITGGYRNESNFFICDIPEESGEIGEKEPVSLLVDGEEMELHSVRFYKSYLLFLAEDGRLCGSRFL